MNNRIFAICLACGMAIFYGSTASAQELVVADTVKTGIYITSIHNIDFKQNEYEVNMWVWFTYNDPELNFIDNLEIPQAKSFTRSFTTIDSTGGKYYVLMKLQCTMKDNWRINNFPFDRQKDHTMYIKLGIFKRQVKVLAVKWKIVYAPAILHGALQFHQHIIFATGRVYSGKRPGKTLGLGYLQVVYKIQFRVVVGKPHPHIHLVFILLKINVVNAGNVNARLHSV